MSKQNNSHQVGRDARNGQFVPLRETVRRPATTVRETIVTKPCPPKKGK